MIPPHNLAGLTGGEQANQAEPWQPAPLTSGHSQEFTRRMSWVLLVGAFLVFCALLGTAGYSLWSYRTTAMVQREAMLIVRAPIEWVTWQRIGRTVFERVQDRQTLVAGDRLRIARSAGYGQAATIRLFDESTLDMWAGADVSLEALQTNRWNDQAQRVVLRQHNGYIRYDLRAGQPYQTVRYEVQVPNASILLEPGGSYSIDLLPMERQMRTPGTPRLNAVQVDVAVRSGNARIEGPTSSVPLAAGQRLLIDPAGTPGTPMPALWQLVQDGEFEQYSEQEYNNTTVTDRPTLIRADTWRVFSGPSGADTSGFFKLARSCQPPQLTSNCPPEALQNVAWFVRSGGQTKGFTTGIQQLLGPDDQGIDISEYRSLVFSLWVRVRYQSIDLTGELGTECPVMVRFVSKQNQPTDEEQQRVICFYYSNSPHMLPELASGVVYYEVQQDVWFNLTIDLRGAGWLPDARYLRSIDIYANGHDYDSQVTDVSLIGSHYAPQQTPRARPLLSLPGNARLPSYHVLPSPPDRRSLPD